MGDAEKRLSSEMLEAIKAGGAEAVNILSATRPHAPPRKLRSSGRAVVRRSATREELPDLVLSGHIRVGTHVCSGKKVTFNSTVHVKPSLQR